MYWPHEVGSSWYGISGLLRRFAFILFRVSPLGWWDVRILMHFSFHCCSWPHQSDKMNKIDDIRLSFLGSIGHVNTGGTFFLLEISNYGYMSLSLFLIGCSSLIQTDWTILDCSYCYKLSYSYILKFYNQCNLSSTVCRLHFTRVLSVVGFGLNNKHGTGMSEDKQT